MWWARYGRIFVGVSKGRLASADGVLMPETNGAQIAVINDTGAFDETLIGLAELDCMTARSLAGQA